MTTPITDELEGRRGAGEINIAKMLVTMRELEQAVAVLLLWMKNNDHCNVSPYLQAIEKFPELTP